MGTTNQKGGSKHLGLQVLGDNFTTTFAYNDNE
jgi:hypothetical protein